MASNESVLAVKVPPPTPDDRFNSEYTFEPVSNILRDLDKLEIPVVRDKGIKLCIEELGTYFGCSSYDQNFLQFWFLDMLVDCIWTAQDEFGFGVGEQRNFLAWVLFVFETIRDPSKNLQQKEFFNVFKETVLIAGEVLDEGQYEVLLPLKLVKILSETNKLSLDSNTSEATETTSDQTVSSSKTTSHCNSILHIQDGNETEQYILASHISDSSDQGNRDSLASAFDKSMLHISDQDEKASSENVQQTTLENDSAVEEDQQESEFDYKNFRKYYQPDEATPSRFLSEESVTFVEEVLKKDKISSKVFYSLSKMKFLYFGKLSKSSATDSMSDYVIFKEEKWKNFSKSSTETFVSESKNKSLNETTKNLESNPSEENVKKIMKGLVKYMIWEQRMKDLGDSEVGLSDWQIDDMEANETFLNSKENSKNSLLFSYENKENCDDALMKQLKETKFLSFAVLWAVIDFVYKNFGDIFQYNLIKMALISTHNINSQELVKGWQIPKLLTEDVTKYVKDLKNKYQKIKLKKKKPKPEPKPKKEKKKESKKKEKSPKGSKKSKKEKDKSSKKDKKSPKKVLTEEEKLKLQQEALEQAERERLERNKKFIFPLQEAVDDQFFMSKFENWQKVDWRNKGGKKDKKKGDKKDKKKGGKKDKKGKKK